LECTRTQNGHIHRIRIGALCVAELNPWHAVAMNHQMNEGRIGVQRLPQHDDSLAMIDSVSQKLRRSSDSEVARHLFPDVVELIGLTPDVGSGACDLVLTSRGIELRRTVNGRGTYVVRAGEGTQSSALRKGGGCQQAGD